MHLSQLIVQLQQLDYSRFLIYLPTIFASFYIFYKGLNIKPTKLNALYLSLISFLISTIVLLTEHSYNMHSKILIFILIAMSLVILNRKHPPLISLYTSIIATGLSYCFKMASYMICAIINVFTGTDSDHIFWGVLIAIVQIFISIIFMKIKRFKNGFSFLNDKNHSDIGVILSGCILFIVIIINNKEYVSTAVLPALFFSIMIISAGIFMWIKRSINQKYLSNLRKKELTKYEAELNQKQKEIENLTNSNTALAKIVHRDNHLFSTLNHTITQHLNSNTNNSENLMREILTMLKERSDLVFEEQISNKLIPTTDIAIIDGTISTTLTSCISHKINFDVTVNCKPTYIIDKVITQTNLQTLLCDHLKDAIIAITSSDIEKGNILLSFDMQSGIYEITIKDNGCGFTIDTLKKLGLQAVTTHKDNGGTGMGFLTTFKTLRNCNASLIITEYKSATPYSKSITFRFDNKCSYIINSHRYKELKNQLTRTDVILNSID